jgi:uncharacterized protein
MKASAYAIPIELPANGVLLLFNTRSGALLEFPMARKAVLETLLAEPPAGPVGPETLSDPLVRQLWKSGFLIPDELDELAHMEDRYKRDRESRNNLSLTIAPTINCNFRCTYCYQEHPNKKMGQDVQDALVERVRKATANGRGLSVTWFGGEPLLALDVVEALSGRFFAITEEHRVGYSAWMITNGSLLTRPVAERLRAIRVRKVQVTLDGPPEIHDRRRFKVGEKPTFHAIVRNLRDVCDLMEISLRINCDRANGDRVPELLDILEAEGLKGRVNPYLAHVEAYTEVCADVATTCMTGAEYSLFQARTYLAMFRKGWGVGIKPTPRTSVCIADKADGTVVDPEGRIYRCWNDMTRPREVVDHLKLIPTIGMAKNKAKWDDWTPFKLSECRECKMLPVCLGGCAFEAMKTPNPSHGDCTFWKHNIEEMVALNYAQIEERQFREALEEALAIHQWGTADDRDRVTAWERRTHDT